MNFFKNCLRHLGFPLLLIGFTALLFQYQGNQTLGYIFLSVSVLCGIFLERVIPYKFEWNQLDETFKSDLVFFTIQPVIAPLVGFSVTILFVSFSSYLTIRIHDIDLPIILQVFIGLILSGLIPYWFHRLAHEEDGFLWKVHSIHHSPKKLYWMNAFRSHPINTIWNTAGAILPSLLFGFQAEAVLIIGLLNNFFSLFNHMNIDFKLGFLNYIFNMAEVHRWHHSQRPEEGNHNYSSGALLLWDQIFLTFYFPKRKINSNEIGLYTPNSFPDHSITKQFLYPICKCS